MATLVTTGSALQCSFGSASAPLSVMPASGVTAGTPAATVMDHAAILNVLPFGMCNCASNPAVIAATAAALGAPTPMPCVPVTPAPWVPGSPTVLVGGVPALQNESKLMCAWGGVIQIAATTQFSTQVP